MSDEITLVVSDRLLIERLTEISNRFDDLTPAMQAIGETLTESTKARFSTSTDPEGKRWAPNAQATILDSLAKIRGAYTKSGRLSKKGIGYAMAKKPLVASGLLQDSFRYQATRDSVNVGTDRFAGEWEGGAALFHWGSKDGKIPPREIVGLSAQDEVDVLDILDTFLTQSLTE